MPALTLAELSMLPLFNSNTLVKPGHKQCSQTVYELKQKQNLGRREEVTCLLLASLLTLQGATRPLLLLFTLDPLRGCPPSISCSYVLPVRISLPAPHRGIIVTYQQLQARHPPIWYSVNRCRMQHNIQMIQQNSRLPEQPDVLLILLPC